MDAPCNEAVNDAGWAAHLELEVVCRGAASMLGRRQHRGPLRVQRAFYPEGPSVPHIYVLHPPGGLVGGDRLNVLVHLQAGARALVTTPAAQKLYRAPARESVQAVDLCVGPAASLEWFPAETIAFDGARARSSTRVKLDVGAAFMGWEIVCWGRQASELPFQRGVVQQSFELYREGLPLLIDRVHIDGEFETLNAAWGYAGLPVFGSLYCVPGESPCASQWVERLRGETAVGSTRYAVTDLGSLLVVRAAGRGVEEVKSALVQSWELLRPALLGRSAVMPRIWAV